MLRAAKRRLAPNRVPLLSITVMGYKQGRPSVDLRSPEGWDERRTRPGYALPATRVEWIAAAEGESALVARAAAIAAVARHLGARSVCSYGVGTGRLEWCLHRAAPELDLVCTDYAPRTVERLREFFPEARVELHDLGRDPPVAADLALLHRVETELSDAVWRQVLAKLGSAVFVVDGFLRWDMLAAGRRGEGEPIGWVRTPRATTALWRSSHDHERVRIGDLDGYLLTPRRRRQPLRLP